MTRYLSSALGAEEPVFSQSVQQLERASGFPSADIRLTADIQARLRQKIAELGLDPADTTGPELYSALHERLRHDEAVVRSVLSIKRQATPHEVLQQVVSVVSGAQIPKQSFTVKQSVAKRMFKKKQPKQLMKKLGYRSLDSMLKHEPVACLYAAAVMCESKSWLAAFYEQYRQLAPSDFEMRDIAVYIPEGKKWQSLADEFTASAKQNMLTFRELGAVVVLPQAQANDGIALTHFVLLLHAMNEVRAFSSYAKLQQVKPDFGAHLAAVVASEPALNAQIAGKQVPWRTIHRFYAAEGITHPEIFEPHVQHDDLLWVQPEDILAKLEPALAFWRDTQSIVMIHNGQPVSCNLQDVAISYYNRLSFKDRIVHFVRDSLWHDVMGRYLNTDNLETVLGRQLSYELAEDLPLAES